MAPATPTSSHPAHETTAEGMRTDNAWFLATIILASIDLVLLIATYFILRALIKHKRRNRKTQHAEIMEQGRVPVPVRRSVPVAERPPRLPNLFAAPAPATDLREGEGEAKGKGAGAGALNFNFSRPTIRRAASNTSTVVNPPLSDAGFEEVELQGRGGGGARPEARTLRSHRSVPRETHVPAGAGVAAI